MALRWGQRFGGALQPRVGIIRLVTGVAAHGDDGVDAGCFEGGEVGFGGTAGIGTELRWRSPLTSMMPQAWGQSAARPVVRLRVRGDDHLALIVDSRLPVLIPPLRQPVGRVHDARFTVSEVVPFRHNSSVRVPAFCFRSFASLLFQPCLRLFGSPRSGGRL
jgi:hypothetical protein